MKKKYEEIYKHYEKTLKAYGPTYKGMDWPKLEDVFKRFKVQLDIVESNTKFKNGISLLDLGCGVGHLLDFIKNETSLNVSYTGVDISKEMIKNAKNRHPENVFEAKDILTTPLSSSQFDFVIMNGVLTEKLSLSFDEMKDFATRIISKAFSYANHGIAFNVMSSHVDWERNDLFHWPVDDLLGFLTKNLSRNIQIRMDYGLYEYTVYVFKSSNF